MEKIAQILSLFCRRSKAEIGDGDQELPSSSVNAVEYIGDANQELPSSVNAVESNDYLLTDILLRLPVISLYVFKFVSKRWLSLITHTSFNLRRSQISNLEPPIGFFIFQRSIAEYDFVSFDRRIPTKRSSLQATFSKHAGIDSMILDSCNGLFLCHTESWRHFVYNPYIDVFKMIPQFRDFEYVDTRIAFDPTKSPHYKVVQVGCIVDRDRCRSMYIYSSETGNWSAYRHNFSSYTYDLFQQGIYWNDAIHWLEGILHCRLDIGKVPVITAVKLPNSDIVEYYDRELFGSRGCLILLSRSNNRSQHLNIFEMRNGNSVWSLKYVLEIPFPKLWITISTTVWSIVLGEKEEDSFMVLELPGKIVEFKFLLNKTLRKLYDLGSTKYLKYDLFNPRMHQFIALSTSI